ncbi:MAG: rhodanese-like domain-containing protein [Bacteroidales bacterium]|jgi:thiosulfate sulfurtransferase
MKTSLVLIIIFIFSGICCHAQVSDSLKYTVLSAKEFQKGYSGNPDAVLIDSRDYKDYKKARIKGAINILWPIPDNYFSGPDAPAKDKSIYVYCYAGHRSLKVSIIFYDHGYRNIYSLKGGFDGWRLKKMEVDKKKIKTKGL